MIAIIVGSEPLYQGPIPLALEHAGLEARPTETTDQAGFDVRNHGCEGCVLVLEGPFLERQAGSATWTSFLAAHPWLPAVLVVWGDASEDVLGACDAPHRILLENPFDAAAAVAAVRRATARAARSVRAAPSAPEGEATG